VTCPSCGSENASGAKFCNECGTPLAAGCPSCGATNRPGAKFCSECGTALGAGAPDQSIERPVQAVAPVSERRLVTVLFADIVGFTPFAEERDAEDVRDTLSRYFDLCAQVIGRYGGTVEKYIGDAVMAVWGAPVAHEDDAERAVRAALDLVDSVTTVGPAVRARAGVLTGEAAVTLGATNQGLVAGDLVNTAARLQSVAQPGTVLVGESTMRASSDAIVYENVGEVSLKGKQAPSAAWRALRVVAEVGGRNRSEQLEAPFVGRQDELRLLKDLFHATAREQKVRLVSVMGPAGIGKSRLAWEFLKYVDGLVDTTYWHSGRSPAYGEGVSFWALGEMIRGRCGLVENDDEETTRRKVAATVEQWIQEEAERAWITPALLTLLGIKSDMAPEQLFAAWRTFFERIATKGIVTLVFEDMHFADSGLLDFIDHLLDWSRGRPIYVVTLARPELLERRPDWGAGKRSFTSLYLEPLSDENMRELLSGLVPGLAHAAAEAIVTRADGIPLYAVETVRMLVADGRLVPYEGTYQPAGDLTTLAVPETLTALISSRLDTLDALDRSLVQDAAVLGQTFSLEALAAVSGLSQSELDQRSAGLMRREVFTRQSDPRSPERGQLGFVQALIREVAYNTLAKRERKARHLAAARYFEGLGSDERASALAGHYVAAHANAAQGPEADALAAQARVALRAAAERATSLAAHDQAVGFLEQALHVTFDPREQADVLERAGRSAGIAGHHDKAQLLLRRSLDIFRSIDDRNGAAKATAATAWDLLNNRQDKAALVLLENAAAEFADLWPEPAVVDLTIALARAYVTNEQPKRVLEITDRLLEHAEHADVKSALVRGLISKGAALGSLGRLREAIALIRAAGDLARENNLDDELMTALVVEGYHLSEVDNSLALEKYREGYTLAERTGRRGQMHQFVNNIGYTSFLVGDWDGGLAQLDDMLTQELSISDRVWLGSNALIIRASRGEDVGPALAELDRLAEAHGDPGLRLPVLDARANAWQAAGRTAEARAAWRELAENWSSQAPASYYQSARHGIWTGDIQSLRDDMQALDATGFHGRVVEARRQTLRAAEAALEGRRREAIAGYREALAAWRELRVVWDEAITGIDMAMVFDHGDAEVATFIDATRTILTRLGARPYLELLERALSQQSAAAPRATHAGAMLTEIG
jgi:class 3 adenylate cyclase/tetratricopeptide (TPR) repeat protein